MAETATSLLQKSEGVPIDTLGAVRDTALVVGSVLALACCRPAGAQSPGPPAPCEAVDGDSWVRDAAARIATQDGLFGFAENAFGTAVACEGAVTSEFDGALFGQLRYRFSGGTTFELETMPPSVGIVTLANSGGFEDEGAVLEAARRYADGLGFAIVWEEPERTANGNDVTERFWGQEPGLNASVSLTWSSGALIAVRVSSAP